jgi:AAA domain-containing protein
MATNGTMTLEQFIQFAVERPETYVRLDHAHHAEHFGMTVEELEAAVAKAMGERQAETSDWRKKFHIGAELESGDIKMHIEGILPEGITALGALSAAGKTWFALAMARALTTGTQFLSVFAVPKAVNVLYLCPEMGARAFRKRLEKLHIPLNDCFYCQTVGDGVTKLDDPSLLAAVAELKPVVFLDTAVRFNPSEDENSARQNSSLLAADLFRLIRAGARAIVCLHHSPKYAKEAEFMTLENVLRGTGDLGAMCDAVWGLQHDKRKSDNRKDWDYEYAEESEQLTRLYLRCVKPRDFEPAPAFRIQGRPYIDEKGDFAVLDDARGPEVEAQIVAAIEKNPKISARQLMDQFKVGDARLRKIASAKGWKPARKGGWETTKPF